MSVMGAPFCARCESIQVNDGMRILHQAGCPSRGFDLAEPFEAEALTALPNGGAWLTAEYLRDTLMVTSLDGTGPRDLHPEHKVWATSAHPGCDWPEETTIAEAYRRGARRVWIGGDPLNPRFDGEEIRVESPVERADRLGRLWASGAAGKGRPWSATPTEEPKR